MSGAMMRKCTFHLGNTLLDFHFPLKLVDAPPSSLGTNPQALCSGHVAVRGDALDVHVAGGLDTLLAGTTRVSSTAHDARLLVVDATLTVKVTDPAEHGHVHSALLPNECLCGTTSTTNLCAPNRTRSSLLDSLQSADLDRHKTFEGRFTNDPAQVGWGD